MLVPVIVVLVTVALAAGYFSLTLAGQRRALAMHWFAVASVLSLALIAWRLYALHVWSF